MPTFDITNKETFAKQDSMRRWPILHGKVWNTQKLAGVIGDQRRFQGERMGGNEEIKRPDRRPLGLQDFA